MPTTPEYTPVTEPYPENLQYKSTKGTLLGYVASPLPNVDRTGSNVTTVEKADANAAVGSPAQGNGLTNSAMHSLGAGIEPVDEPEEPDNFSGGDSGGASAPASAPAAKASTKRSS